jgi:quercetin dioxygenase-like cupin family protein
VSLPDNYKIAPHYHPTAERITVLSGTLQLAEGDSFDTSRLQDLPAGSYATMPAGMHHFASTKGQTVIQLSTIGPWGITYLNPADDPRTRVEAK